MNLTNNQTNKKIFQTQCRFNPLRLIPNQKININYHGPSLVTPHYYTNNAFNSVASPGFILPPNINLNCLLLNAPSYNLISSSVSGLTSGTFLGFPSRVQCNKSIISLITFIPVLLQSIFTPNFHMHFHRRIKRPGNFRLNMYNIS